MGIMFTKMMAPPVPTIDDYEQAMKQDITAPPTAGGLFPSFGGSSGGSGSAPPPPAAASSGGAPPPPMSDPYSESDGTTTFTTESTATGSGDSSAGSGSWFPSFGGSGN